MEESVLSTESANSKGPSAYDVLILHTAEAREWATYLQQILKSSRNFRKKSILLYTVGPADQLHGYNFGYFHSCRCIVLLLSGAFLDMLCDTDLQGALHRLLCPPHRVVVLLCGISEDDVLTETFEDWQSWRKLCADDEPDVYITTVLESITDSRRVETERGDKAAARELHITATSLTENPNPDETEEVASVVQEETVPEDEEEPESAVKLATEELCVPSQLTCLTVQPNRVLCGEQETLFIILTQKVDYQSTPEVEFSSESDEAKRVTGTVENEYTITVAAPDMPAGVASLTMYTGDSCVSLKPVTYYTSMCEVRRYLEKATDPVDFICQALAFTSNSKESLDNLLTDSLKSRMPTTSLQLSGNREIEENNMGDCQYNVELSTMLHFAAKNGLKKLTTFLLQCPEALQAYSETNDTLKSHFEDAVSTEEGDDVYEPMSSSSEDIIKEFSEDIYESMLEIKPECAEDLYEVMNAVDENREEALLRKFFQANPHNNVDQENNEQPESEEEEKDNYNDDQNEEDPYNLCPEDVYDTVDSNSTYNLFIQNRPPAPIPRPEIKSEAENNMTYISRVFSDKGTSQIKTMEMAYSAARPVVEAPTPVYDHFVGMKTPGQRQLISLQERVKVGDITVDEAVQEFKDWQFDHGRRMNSIRYQQENLKRLRESINRRRKEKDKAGKEFEYEISAPLQRNPERGSSATLECAVYEPMPRAVALPPPVMEINPRGSWKTGSTSSTSSTESNRLSTHSTFSYSSGTEPDIEDTVENLPPPPRPPRPSDAAPAIPPRIPPRIPDRVPEKMLHDRYISCPTRALPQRPSNRHTSSAPALPRRLR